MKEIKKITSRAFLPCLVVLCITSCKDMEVEIPNIVSPPNPVLCSGRSYSCALSERGTMKCWGENRNGYLGYGSTKDVTDAEAAPDIPLDVKIKQISCGRFHICAVTEQNTARCWGYGGNGRLGYDNTDSITDASQAGDLNLGPTVSMISAGPGQTCAVINNKSVRCWGTNNDFELLGDQQSTTDVLNPLGAREFFAPSTTNTNVSRVYANTHKCVLRRLEDSEDSPHQLRCWGTSPRGGLLGPPRISGAFAIDNFGTSSGGLRPCFLVPGQSQSDTECYSILGAAIIPSITCVILETGDIRCFGDGANGRLGNGSTSYVDGQFAAESNSYTLKDGAKVVQIAGSDSHVCVLTRTGGVRCWGDNGNGYLGYGHSNLVIDASVLDDLPLGVQAKTVSVGTNFTCVVTVNDTIRCWGIEGGGRLGKVTSEGTTNDIIPAADATELDILK